MDDFQKELVTDLIKNWSDAELEAYVAELNTRAVQLDNWIRHVKTLRKKKRKRPMDTGVRGG